MVVEWPCVNLGEMCTKIGSGATPRGGAAVYREAGMSLIRSQNVYDGEFADAGLARISPEHAHELDNVEVQSGDLLLNLTGASVARVCQVPVQILPARVNQHVAIVRPDPTRLDPRYLLYVLLTPATKAGLLSWADSGGTRQALTKEMIERLKVPLPSLPEQRAIAHILGTLDDKIALNRRLSATLEETARALFRAWFVDFEPVRAKLAGRPSASAPGELAELFPARLMDSELGEVPEGWRVVPFADTVEVTSGGTPKTSVPEYWNGGIPWFSVVDAPSDSDIWVIETEKTITQAGIDNSAARILPIGTTIISARGTVGRLALVGTPMAMNQSCYGLQGRHGAKGFHAYFATRELVGAFLQNAHGSVFDTITRDTFAGIVVVEPPSCLIGAFEEEVSASLERMRTVLFESRALATLRDTLLPRLVSGALRVGGGECQ